MLRRGPRSELLAADHRRERRAFLDPHCPPGGQNGPVGHVDELIVDRGYRCRGVPTVLMQRIEELAVKIGCIRLELDCDFHHKDAHAFYQQRRFERRALLFSKQLG